MTSTADGAPAAPDDAPGPTAGTGTLLMFTATTFLSAVLLFSVQPLFAKMVLPLLGGSPSVWAVALLFFQGALLVGYGYAHLLVRLLPTRTGALVHLGLCLVAFLVLPIAIPESWREPPPGDPYLWQLGLFAAVIGLPFVAVAANAPLLQAWFARTGHADSADPYFLYAASNLGSLLSLLSYPFLLEPIFGLTSLARIWTGGFALLAIALMACAMQARRTRAATPAAEAPAGAELPNGAELPKGDGVAFERASPSWHDRARWVGLALVPSALLTAFTTHVATDVASAPLIWVIPLSLYLLTFVIVFRERALVRDQILLVLHLVAVLLALLQLSQTEHETWYLTAALGTAAFFFSTLVAHRTLYESRPAARDLTEFYLWMSLGGVLGGLFSALIAPKLFSEVFEYPLLLALTFACRPGAMAFLRDRYEPVRLAGILAFGLMLIFWLPWAAAKLDLTFGDWGVTPVVAAAFAAAIVAFWQYPARQLATAALLYLTVVLLPSYVHRGAATRSYFGVYRVIQSDDGQFNVLQHGTTLHGAQRIRDEQGKPVASTTPVTYYHPHSPMAYAVRMVGSLLARQFGAEGRYGVIGLGAGSLACHSASGEKWRFFEIDPVVIGIAKSKNFTYLTNCQPNADIVIGDARLTFAKEPLDSYDLLIVDAFSSDAIPVHLLTREAISLYVDRLKPTGVLVLHISNRYLDLEAVLANTIPTIAGAHSILLEDDSDDGYAITGSTIVVVSKDAELVKAFRSYKGARDLKPSTLAPWTDDASDVLGPIWAQYRKRFD